MTNKIENTSVETVENNAHEFDAVTLKRRASASFKMPECFASKPEAVKVIRSAIGGRVASAGALTGLVRKVVEWSAVEQHDYITPLVSCFASQDGDFCQSAKAIARELRLYVGKYLGLTPIKGVYPIPSKAELSGLVHLMSKSNPNAVLVGQFVPEKAEKPEDPWVSYCQSGEPLRPIIAELDAMAKKLAKRVEAESNRKVVKTEGGSAMLDYLKQVQYTLAMLQANAKKAIAE